MKTTIDLSWSFADKTIRDTSYATHGYYTYPAKFIPQLASRLILENSKEGDIVIDPFMGSGTSIVEAILHKRIGIGTDINEIAALLTKVKTTPIEISLLHSEFEILVDKIKKTLTTQNAFFVQEAVSEMIQNDRIDYWFLQEQKEILAIILRYIRQIQNNDLQDFFLISFAQILKSSSIWLQKSVKPTRDLNKKIKNPFDLFVKQTNKMIKKLNEFNSLLPKEVYNNIDAFRKVECMDSRTIPCDNEQASLIITSPPYVTSYEYADLHQLPSLWFGFMSDLPEFRKKFIGSAYKERKTIELQSSFANNIVAQLKNKKKEEVRNYFSDMLETFIEMKRVLKKGGRACIVIGNTEFQGVKINNVQVFQEQFLNLGFATQQIIKREIPSKMLPSTRDPKTGRFIAATEKNVKMAYPIEYILIMEKK
ncbi:MAG: DNA methyltransferase [Spirochaetota bacterium]|nr:DNA methyltransferase [Spirochaetota bacterium]